MMAKPWNEHRSIITQLYIQDGRKLEDVRVIMKNRYNFEASIRSYRQHFDNWNIGKYNCKKRQRRREAMAKPQLPSPPQTPHASLAKVAHRRRGAIAAAPVRLPSPESLSSMSARSSISSVGGSLHSPEQRPLPDISALATQHRALLAPRYLSLYQAQRDRCADAMGPPPFEGNMHAILRSPNMNGDMLPPITLDNVPIKSEAKYMSRSYTDIPHWNAPRSTTPAGPPPYFEEGHYHLYNTASRALVAESYPGASTPRSMEHSTAARPSLTLATRLPEERELNQSNKKNLNEQQQMASSSLAFRGLVTNYSSGIQQG